MIVIGIDAGGTRTVCVGADESGQVLARSQGPGANLQSEGTAGVEAVLRDLIRHVTPDGRTPAAICLGMAGADRPRDRDEVRALIDRIAPGARVVVVNDALVALEAGLPGAPGVVVIAGTGSIAYGRDGAGRAARAGGWGYVLGDEGSGYWLGRHALRAVVRASDGRGPQTALTARVLAHYGAARPQDLIHEIAGSGAAPSAIAALAQTVAAAAEGGDPIAHLLVKSAAQELAGAAVAVIERLQLATPSVLLAGGTLLGVEALCGAVTADLARRLPAATIQRLSIEPALGAVSLARAELAGRLRLPVYVD